MMGTPTLFDQFIDPALAGQDMKGKIRVWIMGCADYFIDKSDAQHQTGVLYSIVTYGKNGMEVGIDPHESRSAHDIHPIESYFSVENDALGRVGEFWRDDVLGFLN
jgi:hypothetical protein